MAYELHEMKPLIEQAIKILSVKSIKIKGDYEKYKGNMPIFSRELPLKNDFDKTINHDYVGYIVDQSVGYLWGNPLSYTITKDLMNNENEFSRFHTEFNTFRKRINTEDLDAETGKMMGICGYAARLLFINEEGVEDVKNINPWECYFPLDKNVGKYAVRYYTDIQLNNDGTETTIERVEFYDNMHITFFKRKDGELIVDVSEYETGQKVHLFDYTNLIEYANNKERMNDFDKVLQMINAYDETVSDAQSEIEQQRLAILALYGGNIDTEQKKALKQTGMISGLKPEARLEYVIKNINDAFIRNQLKGLKDDIFRFAHAVDFTAESFSGNASGEALKYHLLDLENKGIQKERKFTASQRNMFKVLTSSWRKRAKLNIDENMIEWKFGRNLPVDLTYEVAVAQGLKGFVSEDTRLSLLEIIEDVETEKRKIEEDLNTGMNFDLEIERDDENA